MEFPAGILVNEDESVTSLVKWQLFQKKGLVTSNVEHQNPEWVYLPDPWKSYTRGAGNVAMINGDSKTNKTRKKVKGARLSKMIQTVEFELN